MYVYALYPLLLNSEVCKIAKDKQTKTISLQAVLFYLSSRATFYSRESSSVKLSQHEIQLYMDFALYVYIGIWNPESKYECILTVLSQCTYVQDAPRILSYLDSESRYECILTVYSQYTYQIQSGYVRIWTWRPGSNVYTYKAQFICSCISRCGVYIFAIQLQSCDLIRRTLTAFT